MKFEEIKKGKKYKKKVSQQALGRKNKENLQTDVFVLDVKKETCEVLASIGRMPAQWYTRSNYQYWKS